MAEAKERSAWQRAAVCAAASVAAMGGGFNPEQFIPKRLKQAPQRPKLTPEEMEAEAARTWRMVDRAFCSGKAVKRG